MAVPLLFRILIKLTPTMVRMIQSPQPPAGGVALYLSDQLRRRLYDPNETDDDLTAALSAANAYTVPVATFSGSFELRRLQVIFSHMDAAVATDDVRVCTIDFIKAPGGTPSATWTGAELDGIRTRFATFWNSIKLGYSANVKLERMKIYKLGPDVFPPQVPVQDAAMLSPGTAATQTSALAPQTAVSITEKAGSVRHWGRFYLPPPVVANLNTYGRFTSAFLTGLADAADTMYEANLAAGTPIVVYRRPLPQRITKKGTTLPARPASAWTVDDIQVDDIPDVIRSRRWKYPQLRVQRQVGA